MGYTLKEDFSIKMVTNGLTLGGRFHIIYCLIAMLRKWVHLQREGR
jgi:hypothetical protein